MVDFILENWAELLFAFMAALKVVVNLTPTEKDNQIFGWLDTIINVIIGNRIKDKPEATKAEYVPKKKKKK
tara:strand:- start:8230 stop:8442 length:213 start_codon:yes stop_codon:yes gene_type:complete